MAQSKRSMPETRLDVDLMILDYLLYMATKALLEEQVIKREEGVEENLSEYPLQMVNSFLPVFKRNHPHDAVPDTTRFRLRLLKFTTLYGHRFTECATTPPPSDLQALRQTHRRRAEEWWDDSSDSSFEAASSERQLPRSSDRLPPPLPLSDLVPLFVGLSAARNELPDTCCTSITPQWMELTGEFMLQATLEQCLVYGSPGPAKLKEIFSWGWRANPTTVWEDEQAVNDLFCEEGSLREVRGWSETRRRYMELLKAPTSNLLRHLEGLTRRFPLDRFDTHLLHFLEALQLEQEKPLLAQLETGEVEGLSPQETESLRQRVRLPF